MKNIKSFMLRIKNVCKVILQKCLVVLPKEKLIEVLIIGLSLLFTLCLYIQHSRKSFRIAITLFAIFFAALLIYYHLVNFFIWIITKTIILLRGKLINIDIVDRIEMLFSESFYYHYYRKKPMIQFRRANILKIPSDELLNIWIYQLKCYRQHLITIIPVASLLIYGSFKAILLPIKNIILLTMELQLNHIEKMHIYMEKLLIFDNYSYVYSTTVLSLLYLLFSLLTYYREVQTVSELIYKAELIKEVSKNKRCNIRNSIIRFKRSYRKKT